MKKQGLFFILLTLSLLHLFGQSPTADAGPYRAFCPPNAYVTLGGTPTATGGVPPYTYQWQPVSNFSNPTASNPSITVSVTTTFTVTVTGSNGETKKDTVTIRIYNYSINAGADTTIKKGQTITLHGQANGASQIGWVPDAAYIYNQHTLTPNVFPPTSLTYTFYAVFNPGNCTLYDFVDITVLPTDELFFFNSFTPNGDQVNDHFYIGNIDKYPDAVLEIYNRYGQKVFSKASYQNDWDGKYLNNELPAGTYFYILDTKSETGGKYHGSVNIIR